MKRLFFKKTWLFHVFVLAATAYFAASGTGTLLADDFRKKLYPAPAVATGDGNPVGDSEPPYEQPDGQVIIDRNIFDSSWHSGGEKSEVPKPIGAPAPTDSCNDLSMRLRAVVATNDSRWPSTASTTSGGKKIDLRIGDEVEGYKVVAIDWQSVVLQGPNSICRVELIAEGAAAFSVPSE